MKSKAKLFDMNDDTDKKVSIKALINEEILVIS